MKRIIVHISAVLELPDDFEIANDPEDEFTCLKGPTSYYQPTIQWMCRKHYFDAGLIGNFECPPSVGYEGVDDSAANFFINATTSEEYDLKVSTI
jgi:hypothetical protein